MSQTGELTASDGFTGAEREAMTQRAAELRAQRGGARKADNLQAALNAIAEMPDDDRTIAERIHAIVTRVAPHLLARTWYGMPAYVDGKDFHAQRSADPRCPGDASAAPAAPTGCSGALQVPISTGVRRLRWLEATGSTDWCLRGDLPANPCGLAMTTNRVAGGIACRSGEKHLAYRCKSN